MDRLIASSKEELGRQAADEGGQAIAEAIDTRGHATIVVATGASQFEMLSALVQQNLPWHKVTVFHLDEYVGLPITHPASFRLYLWQRFVRQLPLPLAGFHYIHAEHEPRREADRLGQLINEHRIDVSFIGMGENAHLAFNDPPADFETEKPYLVVDLDEACRQQQFGEGWFDRFEDVPRQAVSMSVSQILKSERIIASVPDERKAQAVRDALEGPYTASVPASALQRHGQARVYLDPPAASLLSNATPA